MKFSNLLDLARLPYFEVKDGRLKLADPALGPVVDCHTHLGLAYGPKPPTVDLLKETPHVELYTELQAIEDLLTGNETERRQGLDRLHQLVRKLRQH